MKMPKGKTALMARMPPSISWIAPHLFLGNISSSLKSDILCENNITAMVSLVNERYEGWLAADVRQLVAEERHLFIPCKDTADTDLLVLLPKICDFIDKQLNSSGSDCSSNEPAESRNVLVHCEQGMSRSATITIAYLMRRNRKTLDASLALVNSQRRVQPNAGFLHQLTIWEQRLGL